MSSDPRFTQPSAPAMSQFADKRDYRIAALESQLLAAQALAAKQAEDDGLWFRAQTVSEAHLQNALRELTRAVEGDLTPLSKHREALLAAQVEAKRLREALKSAKYAIKGREHTGFIDEALATQPDLSALSLHDANERKEGAREALEKAVAIASDNFDKTIHMSELKALLAELDQAPQSDV